MPAFINTPRYVTTIPVSDPDHFVRIGQMELTMQLTFMDLSPYYEPMVVERPEGAYIDPTLGPSRENTAEVGTPTAQDLAILLYNHVVELQEDSGALTVMLSPKLPPAQADTDFLLSTIQTHWGTSYVPTTTARSIPWKESAPRLLVQWPNDAKPGLWRQNRGEEAFRTATPLR